MHELTYILYTTLKKIGKLAIWKQFMDLKKIDQHYKKNARNFIAFFHYKIERFWALEYIT